jgi:hypothetical protein
MQPKTWREPSLEANWSAQSQSAAHLQGTRLSLLSHRIAAISRGGRVLILAFLSSYLVLMILTFPTFVSAKIFSSGTASETMSFGLLHERLIMMHYLLQCPQQPSDWT